jgi:anti-sigma regulatory factor (Ser/Thr protein kinase)
MSPPENVIFENSFPIEGRTFENAGYVSRQVKTLLQAMKFSQQIVRRAAIVTYEAEINICSYANRGRIILRVTPKEIIIEAIDEGPGIADIELAMKEGYSTATENIFHMGFGAGMGLSNIKHYSDIFLITSETGKGTRLKMIIHTT